MYDGNGFDKARWRLKEKGESEWKEQQGERENEGQ
jgi:hypothetical protein